MAKATTPAAPAAPGPLEEPPLQNEVFHGVSPGPVNDASAWLYPMPPASSTMASFAHSTAPASRSLRTTVASWSNLWLRYGSAPHVVGTPFVASRSFTP